MGGSHIDILSSQMGTSLFPKYNNSYYLECNAYILLSGAGKGDWEWGQSRMLESYLYSVSV